MRIFAALLSALVTAALIFALNSQLPVNGSKTPRLGYFLSPQKGFWQNAEAASENFDGVLHFTNLQGSAEVYFDERLVPHVYADNEHDAFFIQGYLHAKFRLWQMDFETYAAAGRLSEIMSDSANGTSFLKIDKFFRRLGMLYGAENSLKAMEADPETKSVCDAYTEGVNAYISSLDESSYPLEYKMLDYKPEPWTNLKSALFLKYMSFDLAGYEEDFEKTNAKSVFTKEQLDALFPNRPDSLDPIVPTGSVHVKPAINMQVPATADSLYFNYRQPAVPANATVKPNKNNGSNNWAVDGSKTKSGRPILCNDPHLSLNLPSLWYEMQIATPGFNAYGVSFPGAPCIIIGFNENCSFGFTNSERDVRDYYEVHFKDASMQEYMYNGEWKKAELRNEIIYIKGKPADTEHIAVTVWGPVMYDASYPDKLHSGKTYACRWKAHDGTNELRTFYKLDYSKNMNDYADAISTYTCPGQNMIFATTQGDIAIKQQAQFPAKWYRQGDFIMPGDDSSYAWRGYIPDSENILMHNPPRGFVSSANQYPYDSSYPYYLYGTYSLTRGFLINRNLNGMQNITTDDMENLQKNNHSMLAEWSKPVLLKYIDETQLNRDEQKYLDIFKNWNLDAEAQQQGATVFKIWWDSLMTATYSDEYAQSNLPLPWPDDNVLWASLKKDSAYSFADNINTPQRETDKDVITSSFKSAAKELQLLDNENMLQWSDYKQSEIMHLLKIPAFSRQSFSSSGGDGIINAFTKSHGPSWKMVVEMTDGINAYGIYPGGQDGNPGSKYYSNFIDDYLAGKYYKLLFVSKDALQKMNNLKGKIIFSKS